MTFGAARGEIRAGVLGDPVPLRVGGAIEVLGDGHGGCPSGTWDGAATPAASAPETEPPRRSRHPGHIFRRESPAPARRAPGSRPFEADPPGRPEVRKGRNEVNLRQDRFMKLVLESSEHRAPATICLPAEQETSSPLSRKRRPRWDPVRSTRGGSTSGKDVHVPSRQGDSAHTAHPGRRPARIVPAGGAIHGRIVGDWCYLLHRRSPFRVQCDDLREREEDDPMTF
jgi:hypothetical protein